MYALLKGCRVPGAGCWVLGAECRVLGARCLVLLASFCGPAGKTSATVFSSGVVAAGAAVTAGALLVIVAAGLSVPGAPASVHATAAETTRRLARSAKPLRLCALRPLLPLRPCLLINIRIIRQHGPRLDPAG